MRTERTEYPHTAETAAAFEALYREYYEYVYRRAYRFLKDPDDAENFSQEAFIRSYRTLPYNLANGGINNPKAWLGRIVNNLCLNELSRRHVLKINRLDLVEKPHLTPVAPDSPERSVIAKDTIARLTKLVNSLPVEQKKVIGLRVEGLGYKEIAERTGKTIAAVSYILFKARNWLKETELEEMKSEPIETKTEVPRETPQPPRKTLLEVAKGIREKVPWHAGIETFCTLEEISQEVGKHRVWVEKHLAKLGKEPRFFRERMGRVAIYFSRNVIGELKQMNEQHPPSTNEVTIPAIARAIGMDREWVATKLGAMHANGEYKRFPSKQVELCFDPTVVEALKPLTESYKPAEEGWFTAQALERELGKSGNWIRMRLKIINATPQYRRDVRGALRAHYSPKVVAHIKDMKKIGSDLRGRRKSSQSKPQSHNDH